MRKLLISIIFIALLLFASACVAAERCELLPGTEYATGVWVLRGDKPYPAALVLGGVHGNEPAGSLAARELCGLEIKKGILIIIPDINKLALAAQVRTLDRIGDINRAYPGNTKGTPAEQLAAEVVKLIEKHQVTLFIDLHEGRTFHRLDKTSVGQMLLFAPDDKSFDLGLGAIDRVNQGIHEQHKKYSFGAHPIPGSGAWYAAKQYGIPAFTVETSGEQQLSERTEQHLIIARYLLTAGGIELK